MKANCSDWYKKGWSLDIKEQSWTENTKEQVDFIIKCLGLKKNEKILDLACGYGRHSLEFARRGYTVTGVDITKVYIEDAIKCARAENLNANFLCEDIRNVSFCEEYDVVLNMADAHFPQKLWDAGDTGLTLSVFEWDKESRIMLYGQNDFAYGEKLSKPDMPFGNPTRLYTQKEIKEIMEKRNMQLFSSYCDYKGTPASEKGFQLIACSSKL